MRLPPRPAPLPLPPTPRTPLRPSVIDDETRTIINEIFPIDDSDMVCIIDYNNVDEHKCLTCTTLEDTKKEKSI